ncbi:unnamed protein product [Oncorhynchus mykiss]|uniref:Uncharacterized protein n=1 Tax=Oncorhynchus mykiss TaxID=8022 RepID=A0A060Y701_ONCMY|nr:unnamed protein product [Oncorhynchus mykiss]
MCRLTELCVCVQVNRAVRVCVQVIRAVCVCVCRLTELCVCRLTALCVLQLQLSVEVEVVFSRGTLTAEHQKKIDPTHTRLEEHPVDETTVLSYRYETRYRTATIMEEDALNQPTAAETDESLHLLSESPCGSVVIYVVPESSTLLPEGVSVYVGQRRTALLRAARPMRVGVGLKEVLAHLETQVQQVLKVMSFSHSDITAALSDRVRLDYSSREGLADSMRAFKSSPG